jgi:dTDP-4-dehydrorhamnose reductase
LDNDSKQDKSIFGHITGVDLPNIDISKVSSLNSWVNSQEKINLIINCAASTNTAKIETDTSTRNDSYKANVIGPKNIAEVCVRNKIKLIHISTDYVFSEKSLIDGKIVEFPVNIYGLHKLLGEKMIEIAFARKPKDFMILRTSWLYGNSEQSFPVKFLKACLNNHEVKVVDDCFGRPTSVQYLTKFICSAIKHKAYGKIDAQPTSSPISRFDFAKLILENWKEYANTSEHSELAKLIDDEVTIVPCKSNEFKTDIQHPQEMPSFNEDLQSSTTPDRLLSAKHIAQIVKETGMQSISSKMYFQWFTDFDGNQTIEKILKKYKAESTCTTN